MAIQTFEDLKPFPGRFSLASSIACICALTTVAAMVYQIPEAAISCYLIIFLMKENAAENVAIGFGVIVVVSVVVVILIGIINLTIESSAQRMLVMAVASFVFLYLSSATKLGEGGGIVALVIAFVLTLVNDVPLGEVATRGVLYAWLMVATPMAIMILYNLAFGQTPQKLLRRALCERLDVAAAALRSSAPSQIPKVKELIGEGNGEQEKRILLTRIFHLAPSKDANWLAQSAEQSYKLLVAASQTPVGEAPSQRAGLAALCESQSRAIAAGKKPESPQCVAGELSSWEEQIFQCLEAMAGSGSQVKDAPTSDPFLSPDAFSNPIHQRFALKTTAAAMICYFTYSAIDWQGIHTAMITCYVACLGSAGETVHKLILRITGCLIGAFLGVMAIFFLIPHMESVGSLAFLVYGAILIAAWVSTGNERISYGGVQIGLAFLLTVLQGFEPSTDLGSARDRIVGILLGNLVVYFIFTSIWPVSVTNTVHGHLASAVKRMSGLLKLEPAERVTSISEVAAVKSDLSAVTDALAYSSFEPAGVRPSKRKVLQFSAFARQLSQMSSQILLGEGDADKFAKDLDRISHGIEETDQDRVPVSQSAQ